jgi:CRP-like cAMP-binding protein
VKVLMMMSRRLNKSGVTTDNRLLVALSAEDFARFSPNLETVSLALGEVLQESGEPIRYVYFPNRNTLASLVADIDDGTSVEVGVVGNEGVIGIQAFLGAETTPTRTIVQIAGSAVRVRADMLREGFKRGGRLQDLLLRYTHALYAQVLHTAVCNHLHSVEERFSRWLLMIHERTWLNNLPLTQELISRRLGAHRSSVSEAAKTFRREGLISYKRGKITILDREGLKDATCGCYDAIKEEFNQIPAH